MRRGRVVAGLRPGDRDRGDELLGREPGGQGGRRGELRAGVDVLVAGAGSGKTCAVLGSVRRAYELAGYRVVGAASSARAARVLADDGGLAACTVARLLLDLDRPPAGGLGPGTVLELDEASMIGTRDMAAVLGHAQAAGAKVIVVGDTRQLAAVDAGSTSSGSAGRWLRWPPAGPARRCGPTARTTG